MDREVELSLMKEAIAEAKKSKAEDERVHPLVGALICDHSGKVLLRAHRGENGDGGHAEYRIFKKAETQQLDLKDKILFVTLEPCTRRSEGKLPCAVRVAQSQIKCVYIGTLDPNPSISGRGEQYLISQGLAVERFPFSLKNELQAENKDFFAEHEHFSAPVVAIEDQQKGSLKLPGNREAILQSSLDLIISSKGPIQIFSGGSSWVRELQVGLLYAALAGREIRILCEQAAEDDDFAKRKEAALASGADVAITNSSIGIRGTLTSPNTSSATLISIERNPTLHGLKLSAPHENGILSALTTLFDQQWNGARVWERKAPKIEPMTVDFVEATLKQEIPIYRDAIFQLEKVKVADLKLLSKNIERFKLFRISMLENLILQRKLPIMGRIIGSPWPYLLPLIEEDPNGKSVVIDGAHRVYKAMEKNIDLIDAVVIRGVREPLPSSPIDNLDEIRITSDKWDRKNRYVDFKPEHFRDIRGAFERALGN